MEKIVPEQPKSTLRRDKLIENEIKAQKLWEEKGINISEPQQGKKKFMITFPYPYMNGRMHLGHAFSLTKAEFMARYKRLRGFNVLFPFAFHCTGMPISAAANKLAEELKRFSNEEIHEYIDTRNKQIEQRNEQIKNKSLELIEPQKILQYNILLNLGVPEEEIAHFSNSLYWLNYFPAYGMSDLKRFGLNTDWRRSFITTDVNPYYDSFIRWQFTHIKNANFIKFGPRPSIFSVKDNQLCADHDRSEGEGVNPQEYTIIKIKLLEFPESLEAIKDREVYLLAATLRPETMYGQTNCYILPTGVYGAFEGKNNEVYIATDRAALNMAYQHLLKEEKKVEKICEVVGQDLIGKAVKAPLTSYEKVYIWPMLSISMKKGTGIVTSVPSDSPDDYAVLADLVNKKAFREKFGLTDEQVLPFEPIPIINIPGYGDGLSAVLAYKEFKVASQNDRKNLDLAKEKAYKLGFYEGILTVGDYAGLKVEEAKTKIKELLISTSQGLNYFEPESLVVSRSGDECVVSFVDQWFLPYGQEEMKRKVQEHLNGPEFNTFNPHIKEAFNAAVDWLSDWGCSRSFGLGTRLPWDEQFLIESLSDSTIYMAYYTVAHYFQSDLNGAVPGLFETPASDVTIQDWDYIFLNKAYQPEVQKIPEEKLAQARDSFRYWYPLDMRVSGKDLIRNHLTMSLYNHAVIWSEENMIPRSIFCNGWVLVDNKKMSKSEGNFFTLIELCEKFGADASRIALANAGDTLNDANVSLKEIDEAILKLSALEMWLNENLRNLATLRTETSDTDNLSFYDSVFENTLKKCVIDSNKYFDSMVLREVVKVVFFGMQSLREDYSLNCGSHGMRRDLVIKYCEIQLLLLYPLAPHFSEITWIELFKPCLGEDGQKYPEYISQATLPEISAETVDSKIVEEFQYVKKVKKNIQSSFEGLQKKKGKKGCVDPATLTKINIIISTSYSEWQIIILDYLKEQGLKQSNKDSIDWNSAVNQIMLPFAATISGGDKKKEKMFVAKGFEFASNMMKECETHGDSAYNSTFAFEEQVILKQCESMILRDVSQFKHINVVTKEEALLSENDQVKQIAANCQPGQPQVAFE